MAVATARPVRSLNPLGVPATPGAERRPARPRLRVVARPRHTRRYVLLSLFVTSAGIFGIVSLNALAAEAAFEARALEGEVTELSLRYDELTAEVAALSAPARVRDVAMGELGMVPARDPRFLLADQPLDEGAAAEDPDPLVPGGPDGDAGDLVKQVLGGH